MNIDGVVFHDHKASGDEFLDTNIHGCDVFKSLRNVIAANHDTEDVEIFLKCANDNVINGILKDAHVNVDETIELNKLYRLSSERLSKEEIILTMLRRGHNKWVSKKYHERSDE